MGSYQEKERSVFTSLLIDFLLFLPDIVAAILANSIIMFADVLKCGSELLATFFAWFALRKISRGKLTGYDYGFGKLENLTEIIVAAVMGICLAIVLVSAIIRIKNPESIHAGGAGLGVILMFIGMYVNTSLWIKNHKMAKKEHSPIMESQWHLFRAKAIADMVIFSSLIVSLILRKYLWSHYIDPFASLIIAGFLLFSIYNILSDSVYDLLDKTLEEATQLIIINKLVGFFDEYKALHGVRSRRAGNNIFIDIFLEFDGEKKMADIQKVIDDMKGDMKHSIKGSSVAVIPTTSKII
jgi:cation diffusion facilitator family transporter